MFGFSPVAVDQDMVIRKKALADDSKPILFDPTFEQAYEMRAQLYERTCRFDEAIAVYGKLIERGPTDV